LLTRVNSTWWLAYGFAVLCVAIAILARMLFGMLGATLFFATFFPAVMFSALYGGVGPGVVAIVFSLVFAWWAFVPYRRFTSLAQSILLRGPISSCSPEVAASSSGWPTDLTAAAAIWSSH